MDHDPDIFDLEEWIGEHHPQVLASLRYISPSIAYDAYLNVWRKAGSPEIKACKR